MKKVLWIILALIVVLGWGLPVRADEIGFGGLLMDGHSEDKGYAVEDGWGVLAHYDFSNSGWKEEITENSSFGSDFGMLYMGFKWEKQVDKEEPKYEARYWDGEIPLNDDKPIICLACGNTTSVQHSQDNQNVYSQILAGTMKSYLELYKDFRLFGVVGAGYEVADGAEDGFVVLGGVGASYFFTKDLGLSVSAYETFTNPTGSYRRYDVGAAEILYRF